MPNDEQKVDTRAWGSGKVGVTHPRVKSKRKAEPARPFTQAEVNAAIERFLAKRKG